ncbi:MAG: hypothetical protein QXN34_01970 [Archaeoglobaceae archaeon]
MEVTCVSCGKEMKDKDIGKEWRACYFCKKPVCFADLHYMGVWREGLYDRFIEVVPVCEKCKPKKLK